MGDRDRQKHIENLKGKQKEENVDRNSDSKKIAALLPVLPFCTDPSSSACFMSSDQFFPHNLEKGNPFCFFGGFRTKLQASTQDVWNKGDDCFVHLGKFRQHGLLPGRPGFYLLRWKTPAPAVPGLDWRRQIGIRIRRRYRQTSSVQLLETPPLPPLATDRG